MAAVKSKGTEVNEQTETTSAIASKKTVPNPNTLYGDFQIPRDKFPDERAFVIAGTAFIESRKLGGVKTDVVVCKLPDPFGDPDFVDVTVCPKWANSGGIFKYRAKKALRSVSALYFPIVVTPVTFYSKKAKRELTIAGLFAKNPFADGFLEFHVHIPFSKEQEEMSVFSMLTSEKWNQQLDIAPTADDESAE